MSSDNVIYSSKVTVNTMFFAFGALSTFGFSLYCYVKLMPVFFDALLPLGNSIISVEEILYVIMAIIWLLGLIVWVGTPLMLLVFLFHRPQEIRLYKNSIYIKSIGDIPLNKITSFDTPIFDYPDGKMPRLHIRRKWRLPLRLATVDEQESFRRLIYQFVENIQKLPEHERPKFKTFHGSLLARLLGVLLLAGLAGVTFFAVMLGKIGILPILWLVGAPLFLMLVKGQRTP